MVPDYDVRTGEAEVHGPAIRGQLDIHDKSTVLYNETV